MTCCHFVVKAIFIILKNSYRISIFEKFLRIIQKMSKPCSEYTKADIRGMTFPELEKIYNQCSEKLNFEVLSAVEDKIRKNKAYFESQASNKTKKRYANAPNNLKKTIMNAWYKSHAEHFNAERAADESMNAQIQVISNQRAKNNAARTAQKQAQANFASRKNKKNLKDMNTCAELEQGLNDIYAELMLYKPVSYDENFLDYLDNLKQNTKAVLDDVKAGKPLPAGFKGQLDFTIDDALDSHMTSARLGEKSEWDKNDRMIEWVLRKKFVPLVHKLLEACKSTAGGKRNTRRNRKNRRTTRKH